MFLILNFLLVVIFVIYIVINLILKKKVTSFCVKAFVIAVLILGLQIVNFASQTRKIPLSDKFFNNVQAIKWQDTEKLEKLGFFDYGDYYIIHKDTDDYMCYIKVEKSTDIPDGYKKHDGIYYKAEEGSSGIFSSQRLFSKDGYKVTRRCTIYVKGMEIHIEESNYNNCDLVFPQLLEELVNNG